MLSDESALNPCAKYTTQMQPKKGSPKASRWRPSHVSFGFADVGFFAGAFRAGDLLRAAAGDADLRAAAGDADLRDAAGDGGLRRGGIFERD